MEIPQINMISNFEAGVNCLQNPSLISRFLSFPTQAFTLWKWGALIFAIFATFNSIIRRIKLILIRFHTAKPTLIQNQETTTYFSDDSEDVSLASSDDEDEEDEAEDDDSPSTSAGEDFRVKGSAYYFKNPGESRRRRRRRCGGAWSEFTSGINVVKLWDSLGLSLDFDEDLINNGSVVSLWGFDQDSNSGEFWDIPAAAAVGAPAMVLTAEKGEGVGFNGYDTRMRRRSPAIYADWGTPAAATEVAGVAGDKVYVRDDVRGVVTVGDVRNLRIPLEKSVRESDGDTWWDADAVIVDEEF